MPQEWWQSWDKLRPGMTREEVVTLLGPPVVVERRIGHGWARYDYPGYSRNGMNAMMYFDGDGQLQEGFRSGSNAGFDPYALLPRSRVGVPLFPFAIAFGLGFISLTLETRPRPLTLSKHLSDQRSAWHLSRTRGSPRSVTETCDRSLSRRTLHPMVGRQ